MAKISKQPGTIRLPESAWALLNEIRAQEGWTKSTAVLELIKFYARQNAIAAPSKEADDDENTKFY